LATSLKETKFKFARNKDEIASSSTLINSRVMDKAFDYGEVLEIMVKTTITAD